MDNTYRFRFLIYLAAFVLFMSVCFAFAEPAPTHPALFQASSAHPGTSAGPVFNPDDLHVASLTTPLTNLIVLRMDNTPHSHFRFFRHHHRERQYVRPLPAGLDGMVVLPSGITISTP